ncbi:glycosyl transferase family group 2-domain-containing protein [Melanogaster broomeanus]|nr:glycosyl transferase family group 2-domain-containing protein [Melanogaster broomeanus]
MTRSFCLDIVRCNSSQVRKGLSTSLIPQSFYAFLLLIVTFIKKAMQTYAHLGGTCSIFVHDDGLQTISEEREAHIAFYANHNIGWVARPKHDGAPGGLKHAGRFKKASTMHYGLALSLKLEKHLKALVESIERGEFAEDDYVCLEDRALELAFEETYEEIGRKWRPWASNGKSLRLGLLPRCGSQTRRVPRGSHNPARIWSVVHVFPPEVAPFVGHNAFLRWSALQDAAFVDPDDGKKKIWSEANVSEDFDMALRLQLKGYIIRWATYSMGGFKEGVSLTVDDELNRWQKYAYRCNELIFNPVIEWWKKGPISKQLRIFVWSNALVHYMFSMMAYMFSYYRHRRVLPAQLRGLGNLGFTLLDYRLKHCTLLSSLVENLKWVPFFFCFFGGLSMHLSVTLLALLFSYNITWGATKKKSRSRTSSSKSRAIWQRFRSAPVLCGVVAAGMVVLSSEVALVPAGWTVDPGNWAVIFPIVIVVGCHILFPMDNIVSEVVVQTFKIIMRCFD